MKNFIAKHLKFVLFFLSVLITVLLGALIGIILVYQKGFHQIENLEDIRPKVMTVVHDDEGNIIKEFAEEKRSIVGRSDIPEVLEKALVTSEDNQFYTHWGINFKGTFRAILGVLLKKNFGGGSSITQQLARNIYGLTRDKSFSRKLYEMLMAIQIEKKYSKDQILAFYCNTIYLGASVYGVEAASKYYFGKSVKDINLAEAVLFPAIMNNPNGKYHVFNQPKNCLEKRDYILKRMLEFNYITEEEYKEAIKVPLPQKPFKLDQKEIGNYFIEETRREIGSKFGSELLYSGGLKVFTTLNSEMQAWAEDSLKQGLRALDKRRGWRGELVNILNDDKDQDLEKYPLDSWEQLKIRQGEIVEGIVLKINSRRAIIKIGNFNGYLSEEDTKWTKLPLRRILKKGDIALFQVLEMPEIFDFLGGEQRGSKKKSNKKTNQVKNQLKLGLEQEPEVEGAILVVDNNSGEIKAMVGGYSFEKSEWNNATQALRQPGSVFKPIIYTAAIENGYNPGTIIVDEPVLFENEWTNEPYEPQNDSNDFVGPLTLRRGLEQSRNVISAKIVEYLTPPKIIEYARNFGISSYLSPTMSIALGTYEVTLKDMVAAYTVFPNLGIRVNPFLIKKIVNQNNHILQERNYYDKKRVIEEGSAYIMNYLLQGVVKYGTGFRARHLEAPIGGKTGTTDGWTNAWFIGFCPSVTVGVWVGFDTPRSLGREETGSRAANPIYIGFMEKYIEKYPQPDHYRKPSGIISVKIDRYTGKLFSPECLHPFVEAFIRGTEPTDFCRDEDHDFFLDYYGKFEEEEIYPRLP